MMRIEDPVVRDVDRNLPQLKAVFYETPKINCYLSTYAACKEVTESFAMSQIRGKRIGVQPAYHEKNIKIRRNGLSRTYNFINVSTQFEWRMISIITLMLHTT